MDIINYADGKPWCEFLSPMASVVIVAWLLMQQSPIHLAKQIPSYYQPSSLSYSSHKSTQHPFETPTTGRIAKCTCENIKFTFMIYDDTNSAIKMFVIPFYARKEIVDVGR